MFCFPVHHLSETFFHSTKNSARHCHESTWVLMWITSYSYQIWINPELSRQIFKKFSDIKFKENPSSGNRVVPCGRTDMTQLIVVFRNFVNTSKNKRPICQQNHNKIDLSLEYVIDLIGKSTKPHNRITIIIDNQPIRCRPPNSRENETENLPFLLHYIPQRDCQ